MLRGIEQLHLRQYQDELPDGGHDGDQDELFMIFNPSHTGENTLKPVDLTGWKLGILNLEPEDSNDLPFPAQHYEA